MEDQNYPIGFGEDILESIFSLIPLINLAKTALHVSKQWRLAVSSSLIHLNPPKPWLFIHHRETRFPFAVSISAYDSRSNDWMQIHSRTAPNPNNVLSSLRIRSSHSSLLYIVSPKTISFSSDPFHLKWAHANVVSPTLLGLVWRVDPVVAVVAGKLIVAGGGCDFEDHHSLSLDIYQESSESMPAALKYSASATWLSVATDDKILYVMEKQSSITHTFDPKSKVWSRPLDRLCPDPNVFRSILTFSSGRLILIGLIGGSGGDVELETAMSLKLWSVKLENLEREEIGEMPKEMFDKMKMESFEISSIDACSAANWLYIFNPSEIGDVYVCEFINNNGCRWTVERIPMRNGRSSWETVAVTCSEVGIYDVDEAVRSENWKCRSM